MIGRTNAGGSGGGGLNLKVVGSTAKPTNPRENTIWVNTTTAITGYALSPTQPEAGTEGLVWLKTADTGVEINVGRKNVVLLHLAGGMLYTGGKWASVDAWAYINSVWKQFSTAFDGRLYDNGDQCTDITGGWGITDYKYVNSSGKENDPGAGTLESDHMHLASTSTRISMLGTAKPIDLDGLKTLTVDWQILKCHKDATNALMVDIQREKKAGTSIALATLGSGKAAKRLTSTLDISNLSGKAYVVVRVTVTSGSSSDSTSAGNIYSIKAS
nr:MAG TPA: hypothetical protein [Caudoviricetes sp.]